MDAARKPANYNYSIAHSTGRLHLTILSVFLHLLLFLEKPKGSFGVSWELWWTYDGISGPAFWGLINPDWSLCNKGRRQSPINLEPSRLLFDPNLRPIHIDKDRVNGYITNTGHSVIFYAGSSEEDGDLGELSYSNGAGLNGGGGALPPPRVLVNITGGPLSYRYQFHEIHLHYGLRDDGGSEHSIGGYSFPAELQIFGFNSQLYSNFSEGQSSPVQRLSIQSLLPNTENYMTYEGSTTMPACYETVIWVILNKPIYITKQQLYVLRKLMQGDEEYPKAPLGSNFRPPQPLHHRPVRTNIDFNKAAAMAGAQCTVHKNMQYKANLWKSPQ